MKKLILFIAASIMSLNNLSAGNGNVVREEIIKELKLPADLKTQTFIESVNVEFKIESNGKVSVLRIKTSNENLKSFILQHFSKIDFSKLKEREKESIYNININFKVI